MSKSKIAIQKALVELLAESEFERISVIDIVAKAGIARATFYLHFNTKQEVLLVYIDGIFQDFYERVSPSLEAPVILDGLIGQELFRVFRDEATLAKMLLEPGVYPLFLRHFQGYVSRIAGRILRSSENQSLTHQQIHHAVEFWAGGSLSLIANWAICGFAESPEEMGRLYAVLTQPSMTRLLL